MNVKLLSLAVLTLALLTACGTAETAVGYSYVPPTEATQEETDAQASTQVEAEADIEVEAEIEVTPEVSPEEATSTEEDDLSADPNVLEISENVFITQINDIYYNFEDYADKTIIVEGMYAVFYSWDETISSPGVYRLGPGCCGNDGWGGFMLNYDGELPEENDWIRVVGTPELVVAADGYIDLFLNVISLEVKEERGAEMVLQ